MNIYIGNLSYNTNENEISELFHEYGEVSSVNLVKDRDTNRLKGFGFIEIDDAGGRKAIQNLNEYEFNGRKIVVNEARPKKDNDRSSGKRFY